MKNRKTLLKETLRNYVSEQMGDVHYSPDSGYHTKNSDVYVTKEDAELIEKVAKEMYDDLFKTEEGIVTISREKSHEDNIKASILKNLKESGIKIDHDDEEGEYYFWISPEENMELAKEEFKGSTNSLYDRIMKS
jgi:hypothetical protein